MITLRLFSYLPSDGYVHGWDLRCKKEAWNIKTDKTFGRVQCFALDCNRNWLAIGSLLSIFFFNAFSLG